MRRSFPRALGALLVLVSAVAGPERASDRAPVSVVRRAETARHAFGVTPPKAEPPAAAAPTAERAPEFTLIAGGDVSFGRKTGQRLLRDSAFDPFRGVAALFATGDLRFVNLESTLSDQNGETEHPTRPLTFTGPPSGARALAHAGIELVSVANNHAWDYGAAAYFETLAHLERAGVAYAGGSRAATANVHAPRVLSVRGWSMAWFAVTAIWNTGTKTQLEATPHVGFANVEKVTAAITAARPRHDLVLVSYHGGAEYSEHIAREQREFAKAVMAAGADAVIGHHPHVPQGVEWFGDRPVLHSLGNLVFNHHRDHAWTGRGFVARLRFAEGAPTRVELCPYHITETGPVTVSNAETGALELFRSHLKRVGAYAGFSEVAEPGEHGCMRVAPRAAMTLAARTRMSAAIRAD